MFKLKQARVAPAKTKAASVKADTTPKGATKVAKKPIKRASKAPKKRLITRQTAPLRKRNSGKVVDLGIGAVNIEPAPGALPTLGLAAAQAAMDKKATDVTVLDVRGVSGLCDEMVVASARSVTHLHAVADGIEEALRKAGERLLHADGRHSAEPDWVLLDYGNLMVHLFRPEARASYRLEDYYADAKLVAKWKND